VIGARFESKEQLQPVFPAPATTAPASFVFPCFDRAIPSAVVAIAAVPRRWSSSEFLCLGQPPDSDISEYIEQVPEAEGDFWQQQ
ncbi:hypothetical protein E2562_016173, partial [Oryza meyeriana var. granulata]